MKPRIAPLLLAPLLLLAACEEEAAEVDTSATGGKAAGEVLGGTISDEMIPLETLTSTSPPMERPRAPAGSAGTAPGEDAQAETQEAEAPQDAPAPETSAEEE